MLFRRYSDFDSNTVMMVDEGLGPLTSFMPAYDASWDCFRYIFTSVNSKATGCPVPLTPDPVHAGYAGNSVLRTRLSRGRLKRRKKILGQD